MLGNFVSEADLPTVKAERGHNNARDSGSERVKELNSKEPDARNRGEEDAILRMQEEMMS